MIAKSIRVPEAFIWDTPAGGIPMRPLATTAVFLASTGWCAAADGPKDAAKKLAGTYEVVEVWQSGGRQKNPDLKGLVIKDDEIVLKLTKDRTWKFSLDPSKTPAHLDITAGPNKLPGIYAVKETDKGTELAIALTEDAKGERPKDFKGEGKNETTLKLFRKK